MPEITCLIYTARDDYPFAGKAAGMHCFEPTMRTLAAQTFKDFEVVVVDALWESRSRWFEEHPQPFAVKHVPSRPNYWQERGRPGLSAQLNRGFIWADGRYIWMADEKCLFPQGHLELVATLCRAGYVPSAWYGLADRDPSNPSQNPENKHVSDQACPNITFDLLGFTRDDIYSMDHRAARFAVDSTLIMSWCHSQQYYGYSAVPTEAALAVNGFEELMDSQMALQDCEFGGRLGTYGCNIVMHRDLYVVSTPVARVKGYGGQISLQKVFKCNYAIYWYNKLTGRTANTELPPNYVEKVQEHVCRGTCEIRDACREGRVGESEVYPFCGGDQQALALEWFAHPPVVNLRDEVEKRKRSEPPYDRVYLNGG